MLKDDETSIFTKFLCKCKKILEGSKHIHFSLQPKKTPNVNIQKVWSIYLINFLFFCPPIIGKYNTWTPYFGVEDMNKIS